DRAAATGAKPDATLLDADGDGAIDLAIAGALPSGAARLYLGGPTPGAGFRLHDDSVLSAAEPAGTLTAADVDQDGHTDLLLGRAGGAQVLLGHGGGAFARGQNLLGYRPPRADRFALFQDLDGDGVPDLIASAPLG